MVGKGFGVHTGKLLDVAETVSRLREDLAGTGSAAGSLPNYQTRADASVLRAALSSFWDGQDVFADAYDTEHRGIVQTMQVMLGQLDALERACRSTAAEYGIHETETKASVAKTDPGRWS